MRTINAVRVPVRSRRRIVLLAAIASLVSFGAAAALLSRDALWIVVRSCVFAKEKIGTSFPCLEVDAGSEKEPGYAVLRAPGSPTHVIVTPIVKVEGIESPDLQQPAAGAYWRAALAARSLVVSGADGRVPLSAVGLAVNSDRTRSQDQLHIHAECIKPSLLRTIRATAPRPRLGWQPFPTRVDGDRFFVRRLRPGEIATANLFATLAALPGTRQDLSGVTALLVAEEPSKPDGDLILLGSRSRSRTVEHFFDASCRKARS